MTHAQEVLHQQFVCKIGKYNRHSEALGFTRINFIDSLGRKKSFLLAKPISFKKFASIPFCEN
jgi:hypothetical protein